MTVENLNALSVDELGDLIERAEQTRAKLVADRKAALKADFEERLKAEGFAISDVICAGCPKAGQGSVKRERKTMPPKYAHPDKPELTWSGLGRKPAWLQELLAEGKLLGAMRITR